MDGFQLNGYLEYIEFINLKQESSMFYPEPFKQITYSIYIKK